jgi:Flp pilus assembly protein TadD
MTTKLIVIALDGADPALISPLIDNGALPVLGRIVESGVSGSLVTQPPLVRAMAWTSVATGVHAPTHGVLGDVEPRPDLGGVRPVSHRAWRRPAYWEWLRSAGIPCATIGWPATRPADSWASTTVVDDTFALPRGTSFDAWAMLPGCVHPVALRTSLRELRVHPADITPQQIVELVPRAAQVDQDADDRLARLATALAHTATLHAVATQIAARDDWQCLTVFYPWLAAVQRTFMDFHPPPSQWASEQDQAIYGRTVENALRLQDAMIGVLLQSAPAATVLLVSAYGWAHGSDRVPPTAALPDSIRWHRSPGFVAAAGEHVRHDVLVHGMSAVDVAPTVLAHFGLTADHFDGAAIDVIAPRRDLRTIESPPAITTDDADAAQNQDVDAAPAVQVIRRAWALRAAEALLALGRYADAADAYSAVIADMPDDALVRMRLASCWLAEGRFEETLATAIEIVQMHAEWPWGYLLAATAEVMLGRAEAARPHLAAARARAGGLPNASLRLGSLHLALGDWQEAESLFRQVVETTPNLPEGFDGLGCALHAQARFAEAESNLRRAVALRYHYPLAHYHLAMTLACLKQWDPASRAAHTALAQDPRLPGLAEFVTRIELARGADAAAR